MINIQYKFFFFCHFYFVSYTFQFRFQSPFPYFLCSCLPFPIWKPLLISLTFVWMVYITLFWNKLHVNWTPTSLIFCIPIFYFFTDRRIHMASSLKCLSFYFLVLVLISSTAIQGRPFNGLKKPQSPAGAGVMGFFDGLSLRTIKQSRPSPGEGNKFTNVVRRLGGGINKPGPSPGQGHEYVGGMHRWYTWDTWPQPQVFRREKGMQVKKRVT